MCGIFGLVEASSSALFSSDQKIVLGLSLLTSMRGPDSTGFFGVDVDKGWIDILKGVGSPYDVASYKIYEEFYGRIVKNYNLVVGHGRLATIGNIVAPNAHPFQHGNITLVHNGTLTNFKSLQDKFKTKFDVDSELICYLFNKIGVEETIKEIEGAYAMAWWDSSDKTLNLLRNSQRPLSYAISENQKRLLFASEPQTLGWAAINHKTDKFSQIKDVAINDQMKIPIIADKYDQVIKVEHISRPKWTTHTHTHSNFHGLGYYGEDYEGVYTTPTKSYPPPTTKPTTKSTIKQTIICLKEDLQFNLKDYDELETVEGDKKTFLLSGTVDNCPHVEVVAKFVGTETDMETLLVKEDPVVFFGKVQTMRWLGFGGTIRVFLDKAEPVGGVESEIKSQLVETGIKYVPAVPAHVNHVKIKGQPLSVTNFIKLASKGCYTCGGELKFVHSDYFKMIYVTGPGTAKHEESRLVCKECSEKDYSDAGATNGAKSTSTVQ